MPHYPYYFTKEGHKRPTSEIEDGKEININEYLEYVEYTNKILLNIVDAIKRNATHPPIIIIVSDHGFREYPNKVDPKYNFINQLCIYLPDGGYRNFYNGISNVNLFRVLFNTSFRQKFPLLTDSTIYIRP
jgi:phosphoglycerol transferase MdoB-like AlkP superfamily enzyme